MTKPTLAKDTCDCGQPLHYGKCDYGTSMEDKISEILETLWQTAWTRYGMEDENVDVDKATHQISKLLESAYREGHMDGWHEGRAAANNPEYKYGFSTGDPTHKSHQLKEEGSNGRKSR